VLTYLVVTAAILFGILWLTRAGELFCLAVKDGHVLVVRGRAPAGFVSEVKEVVRGVRSATIRGVKGEDRARLSFSGDLGGAREQRLRNLFALYPASKLRQAPAIARPTLGQILGIAWLAWLLDRSRY
jgi:hypothetical protein